MEFEQSFIQENELTEQQVAAITGFVDKYVSTELGTKVHEHTENNLNKIWETVSQATGIEREQGEKFATALQRASKMHIDTALAKEKEGIVAKARELEEKIKTGKLDEALKAELDTARQTIDSYKKKAALYEEWEKEDYKGKHEALKEKLSTTEKRIAFTSIRPSKPDTVNQYEWDAKLKEWERDVIEKNNIVFDDDNVAWAVNKDNEFIKEKLSELIKQHAPIQDLLKERKQTGIGSHTKEISIEGLPFKLPENATRQEVNQAIRDYLKSKGIDKMNKEYSKEFDRLNKISLGLAKKPEK